LENKQKYIEVINARVHNLNNVNLKIPKNKLVVFTGISGSGKSSLAFDTIYSEGQRRYVETFSAYARHFLHNLERPDVDKISGLSPVIAIDQKTITRNPRSTVGTITEIYDFLRLLYAKSSDAYSYISGKKMVKYTNSQIIESISKEFNEKNISILTPLVKARKGHYRELFEQVLKQGYLKVRVDGIIMDIVKGMQIDRYKIHDIELLIDRISVKPDNTTRLTESVNTALRMGKGMLSVLDYSNNQLKYYSKHLMCMDSGISYDEPEPNNFSFNSPYGSCKKCNGLGYVTELDLDKIIPNKKLSLKRGAIVPVGEYKQNWLFKQLEIIGLKYNFNMNTPLEDISEEGLNAILYGTNELIKFKNKEVGITQSFNVNFEGIVNFLNTQYIDSESESIKKWASEFMNTIKCPECNGKRLKKESLYFIINDKNIADLAEMDIINLQQWFIELPTKIDEKKNIIAKEIIREIDKRLKFLLDVGLGYLSLNRNTASLSGGESQRIRLASQIGSQLIGVLYILDEPSIGLHQRDNHRLIESLKRLRDLNNSIIVVEHDLDMILAADYIFDIGPLAGIHGGNIVSHGTPQEIIKTNSLTAKYINGIEKISIPEKRRKGNGKKLTLKGAKGNNLKNISVEFPLGKMICITGVSGSGKSTLIYDTLFPILSNKFYHSKIKPLEYSSIDGIDNIDKVIEVNQQAIGRTPRSNPATYTGVFTDIRNLFAILPESKIRGYKPGRFSFNVKGGRCEECRGAGIKTIEMNFLPNVYVTCDVCQGKRYNRQTLEVRYKGKSINDVLDMDIDTAVEFFENIPAILSKIQTLKDVGLGYIKLGQASTTLSGGEAQRVKLATELSRKNTGNTLYILDEPTTGLHFEDIRILLDVLDKLVEKGNTVLIIEHNLDVIKTCDHIIDMGPEGGNAGGEVLCFGTPEKIVSNKNSYTAHYLKDYM